MENSIEFEAIEVPKTVFASGSCGTDATWTLYNGGELVIEGTGKTSKGDWSDQKAFISNVTVKNGITSIYSSAFSKFTSLTNVDLPEGLLTVDQYAFSGCTSLRNIELPDTITYIGQYAFQNCTSLLNIKIPDGVTEIKGYIFMGCSSLSTVDIHNKVTLIGASAFQSCKALSNIELPSSVTTIGPSAFSYCSSLNRITILNRETTFGSSAFKNVSSNFAICGYLSSTAETFAEDNSFIFCPVDLKIAGANLTLQNNIAVNYRVNKENFDATGYTDPYVVFEFNGNTTTVTEYTVENGRYVFKFRNIAPSMMGDTISGTLYASYNGKEYQAETIDYSVAEYCYSMLELCTDDEYAAFRTLLVDLLTYGAKAQLYTDYKTDKLVNAALTAEQLANGTQNAPTLSDHLKTDYATVSDPAATWKGASLLLNDSVTVRARFAAENIEELSVKITVGKRTWTIPSSEFEEALSGGYYVKCSDLTAGQFSEKIYLTVMNGDTAISNTLQYSIETYAYWEQNSSNTALAEMVKAMMNYGNAAYAYAH